LINKKKILVNIIKWIVEEKDPLFVDHFQDVNMLQVRKEISVEKVIEVKLNQEVNVLVKVQLFVDHSRDVNMFQVRKETTVDPLESQREITWMVEEELEEVRREEALENEYFIY